MDGGALDAGLACQAQGACAVLEAGEGAQQNDRAVNDLYAPAAVLATVLELSRRNVHRVSGFRKLVNGRRWPVVTVSGDPGLGEESQTGRNGNFRQPGWR